MTEEHRNGGAGTGDVRRTVSRSVLREATIRGVVRTKADSRSVRLTPGQRRHIVSRSQRAAG